MKKNSLILKPRGKLSLGDLIMAVSSCTTNTKETVATVADLLGSGKVKLQSDGKFLRAKVCSFDKSEFLESLRRIVCRIDFFLPDKTLSRSLRQPILAG